MIGLRDVFSFRIALRSGSLLWFLLSYSLSYSQRTVFLSMITGHRIYLSLLFLYPEIPEERLCWCFYEAEAGIEMNHSVWVTRLEMLSISQTPVLPLACCCLHAPSAPRHSVLLVWCLPDGFLQLRIFSPDSLMAVRQQAHSAISS